MRREHHLLSPIPAVQLVTVCVCGGADVGDDGGSMGGGAWGASAVSSQMCPGPQGSQPTTNLWREGRPGGLVLDGLLSHSGWGCNK